MLQNLNGNRGGISDNVNAKTALRWQEINSTNL